MTAARVLLVVMLGALALAPTASARKAYVTQNPDVAVLETATNTPSFPVGLQGYDSRYVVFAPDGALAYVSTGTDAGIHVVDTATDTVVDTISTGVGTSPMRMALNPAGTRLYAASANSVLVIDTVTRSVVTTLPSGGSVGGIAVSPDGSRVYFSDRGFGEVREHDIATNSPTLRSPFGAPAGPNDLGVTPDGATLVSSNNGGSAPNQDAYLFALSDASRRDVFTPAAFPGDVAVAPDGRRAYQVRGSVTMVLDIIDLVAGAAPGSVTLDAIPDELAFGPDGSRVYAPANDAEVKVIDTATDTVVASPAFFSSTDDIAVSPNQGPAAAFTATPAQAGQATRFDASTSTDDTGVARYDWEFGDGATASTTSPAAEHVFPRGGDFDVTLTVTDTEGGSTQDVFTGQQMLTNGSDGARRTQRVTIAAAVGPPTFASPEDTLGPVVRVRSPRRNGTYRGGRKLRRIRGTAQDRGAPASGVRRVRASVVRRGKKRCRVLRADGRLVRSKTCRPKLRLRMKGTSTWSRRLKPKLPRGRYTFTVRATDIAGNRGPRKRVRFRVR